MTEPTETIFLANTILMSKSQHADRQYNDHHSIDSGVGGAKLPISDLIETILRQIKAPRGNPGVTVHIDNLYCVTSSQHVQINPSKHQHINTACGDQDVNLETPRELTKRSLLGKSTADSKCMTNEPHHTDIIDSGITYQGRNPLSEKHQIQSDEPWIRSAVKGCPDSQSVQTLEKLKGDEDKRQPEHPNSYHVDVPALKLYIDGKPLTDTFKPKNHSNEDLSSKFFQEEMRELLLQGNTNTVGKRLHCDRKEEPPCTRDIVTFRGGLEISYEDFRKIIESVSERPDLVKCIVPGGVTGPLSGYFQKVDRSLHEHALVHGVCLLDNGLLVPLRAMLRILKLHAWLCDMVPHFVTEDVRKLHSSIKWTQTDSIVDLLRCFIKSNKIHVVLPGTSKVPFVQFEQEEEHIPKELQTQTNVEMLGFNIPYNNFREKLFALCKENSK